MADQGARYTEQTQAALVRRMRLIYRQAQEEIIEKLNTHNRKMSAREKIKRAQLKRGEITEEEFNKWLYGQMFVGKQWQDKVTSVATTLLTANEQANAIIEGKRRAVFGENATWTAYQMEKEAGLDLSFGVYDSATVTRLLRDEPELLPRRRVNGKKDKAWNRRNISNAVTQGIIQGESIPEIAQRIAKQTGSTNMKAMTRYARTAMTSAQNAGRIEAMRDALDMGIKVKKKWIAILDSRTRDAHADLDGQVQEVNKPFDSTLGDIMYPGDPAAHPGNVYNCRCALGWVYDEYPEQYSQRRAYVEYVDDEGKYHRESHEIANMSYKVWKLVKDRDNQRALEKWKQEHNISKPSKEMNIVQGKDLSGVWERREKEFPFAINDIINAQGFDGLPQVLSKEQFDEAVKESKFIAQRSYSARSQKELDEYREMLYNGKWYVDCSVGGAQYGQGMYCAADYNGVLSDGIKQEMEHYSRLNKDKLYGPAKQYYIKKLGIKDFEEIEGITEKEVEIFTRIKSDKSYSAYMLSDEEKQIWKEMLADGKKELMEYKLDELVAEWDRNYKGFTNIETFTLSPDAKIITYDELTSSKYAEEVWKYEDLGVAAAVLGFDAINAERHGASGSYTVILNRTKLIILGE
jgi:SPP1 gp7 family putative phage head morphogenesis protein